MFSKNEIFLNRGFKGKKLQAIRGACEIFFKKRSGFLSGNNVLWCSVTGPPGALLFDVKPEISLKESLELLF